ncbi:MULTISPECIES: hypothetical protein [Microbacterium]|uniref:hypothetical protein n=1 Tax=Microbacterium TaxID=33882 RepID=UPI00278325AA|nr:MULTISPECIES: hypothetical protein [Microbacterium]MDQ1083850.1 FtsH-binding integral membrane protein [Microbacterium sp. SORGH_AS_0344]MDQ1170871.1 FtsH-binding integral membrane protein [Microbacterium proteolyticum]
MTSVSRRIDVGPSADDAIATTFTLSWPWWLRPSWAFALLTGTMALIAISLPSEFFVEWRVPDYLDVNLSLVLVVLLLTFLLSTLVGAGLASRGGSVTIAVTVKQLRFLRRAYRLLLVLSLAGYALWLGSAISQGVSIANLTSVLDRDLGAISELKANSRPIGGLTTFTQFGPVAIALGVILRKIDGGGRIYWVLIGLAAFRAMFYAERLALIEAVLPLILLAALTAQGRTKRAALIRVAPIVAPVMAWALFATFEYSRSWVYYQNLTSLPFAEWVSLRLAGYYTTSFNNSALMVDATRGINAQPYFAIDGFWNFPVVAALYPHQGMQGLEATAWWANILKSNANPEFNNTGSFLVSYAEFGIVFALLFWVVVGLTCGVIFARMTRGSIPALLAVTTLFVGLLELSRFTYWTQGRAFPVLLATAIIALTYPRIRASRQSPRQPR